MGDTTLHPAASLLPLLQQQCSSSPTLCQAKAALAKQHFKPPVLSWLRSSGSSPHSWAHSCPGSSAGTGQDRAMKKQRLFFFEGSFKATPTKTCLKLQQSSKPGVSSVGRLEAAASGRCQTAPTSRKTSAFYF